MRLSQAMFRDAVREIVSDRSVLSYCAAESPTRADGYGYVLEARDAGVFANHPKKPGVERLIPWSNVKWVDVMAEPDAIGIEPEQVKRRPGRPRKMPVES